MLEFISICSEELAPRSAYVPTATISMDCDVFEENSKSAAAVPVPSKTFSPYPVSNPEEKLP